MFSIYKGFFEHALLYQRTRILVDFFYKYNHINIDIYFLKLKHHCWGKCIFNRKSLVRFDKGVMKQSVSDSSK